MNHRDNRSSQLDAAILTAVTDLGGFAAWADVRDRLPTIPYWRSIEALVRLQAAGVVDAVKINGRTYVGRPLVTAA